MNCLRRGLKNEIHTSVLLLILVSCTSANQPSNKTISEFVRMNEIWQKRLSKDEVVNYLGPYFKEIEEGIS